MNNLGFVSVQVRDLERSSRFYTEVLGFERAQSPNPDAVLFKNNTGAIFAIRKPFQPLDGKLGTGVGLWFTVPNVDVLAERVTAAGATVTRPLGDGPFGRMFVALDPDGYALTLHQG